ncbi:decaprenyl-phosphate phosphoribosyltransferase [Alicyclobacillus acidiphilus]|uniref:decaprenyl-phosphate phosphoribosyltransferase n=1 Tax=Alicyclobacillus acidiphilus TaxID=182455 RepID=UPI000831D3E1|nr:decaprenyl-phosphate phosphoribosyltransferase [Alicyclobacillus acidiphilus]
MVERDGMLSTGSNLKRSLARLLFTQLRPSQWTKNVLVFAAFVFTLPHVTSDMFLRACCAFVLFSGISGTVYILNDYVDLKIDVQHPEKRHRPMASGQLSPRTALVFGGCLLFGCMLVSYRISHLFSAVLAAYFLLNIAYSTILKHVVVIDILSISMGFVFRSAAGGLAISVPLTPWFLFCTLVLSLFLATGKRRYEYRVFQQHNRLIRRVLFRYSDKILNALSIVTAVLTILSYSVFTLTSKHSHVLMCTVPLVVYGIVRYMVLIDSTDLSGSPESILIRDAHIRYTAILYVALVVTVLVVFG